MAARAAFAVCWRCAVLLAVAAVVTGFVAHPGRLEETDGTVFVTTAMYVVHLGVLAVLGFPLGWALSAWLGPRASVVRAVGAFAATGAVAAAVVLVVMLLVVFPHDLGSARTLVPGWAGLGAVVAGLSRWWAHRGIRRRGATDSRWPPER